MAYKDNRIPLIKANVVGQILRYAGYTKPTLEIHA